MVKRRGARMVVQMARILAAARVALVAMTAAAVVMRVYRKRRRRTSRGSVVTRMVYSLA